MNKKKIAIIVPKYGLVGGGEQFVFELTERLASNPRYQFHVIANQWQRGGASIIFHYVPIITFPKWLTTLSFACFANYLALKIGVDLIHTHDRVLAADICTLHSIPHYFWVKKVRRKKIPSLFDFATSWTEKHLANNKRCQWFLPVSSQAAEETLRVYPSLRKRMKVVHPGVDIERFCPPVDLAERQRLRAQFGFMEHEIVVLFVGMNFEVKGLDTVLAGVALANQHPDSASTFKVLVVGKGDREKYQAQAERLGISELVTFAGIRDDMPSLYQASDIFTLLSFYDTFGMVVTEAMATGLPVLVSRNVGAKDLVAEGQNGFVIDPGVPDLVCRHLLRMASSSVRRAMSIASRETAISHSWDEMARQMEDVYEQVLRS
ncbi:glycosyltransferase family 4 protein [Thermodesulfobacteriota bacterium]